MFVQKIDFQLLLFVYSVTVDRNGMANNRGYKNWNDFEVLKVNGIVYFRLLYLTKSCNSSKVSCCYGKLLLEFVAPSNLYIGKFILCIFKYNVTLDILILILVPRC